MGKARIVIKPEVSSLIELESDSPAVFVVGNARDCSLRIPRDVDPGVSRHHCVFDLNPPYATVEDLGSKNGTYLNGKDVRERNTASPLVDGDRVQVCNTVFCITVDERFESKVRYCIRCGKNVSAEKPLEDGDYLCKACRDDPPSTIHTTCISDDVNAKELISGYRIIRQLGSGALGKVYLAQKQGTIKQMALKLMLPSVAIHENNRTRFLREVEALQALNHPNIVHICDSGYDSGIFFIALEFCNHGTLEDYVLDHGRLKLREAIHFALEILDALDYAHNKTLGELSGIVHRDVKPGNILLHETRNTIVARLADFGLCKAFNGSGLCSFTQTGTVAGTFSFMCRHQLLNYKHANPEVDVWSAAAILYFMLTGHTPRKDSSFVGILDQLPRPIQDFGPEIPEKLAELIDEALDDQGKALAFQSALELKNELLRFKVQA